jgi:hypothetical protein
MTTAILGVIAALTAALIGRSVMIGNHRQAWIDALREDLAKFFTSIDVIHFRMAMLSHGGDVIDLENQQKARNDVLLTHRRILMRLNMSEPLHQRLERALEMLLVVRDTTVKQDDLTAAVTLAGTVLKHEWDVTKYGAFTTPIVALKKRWKRAVSGGG